MAMQHFICADPKKEGCNNYHVFKDGDSLFYCSYVLCIPGTLYDPRNLGFLKMLSANTEVFLHGL